MEPTRSPQATLNDLLDRILDKGLLLNTDLIISVAGIPLIGVNLKLALAGMETMLDYGIMKDWDEAQRAVAAKETERKGPALGENEYVVFSVFGTHWYSKGIYNTWRAGTIYVTNKRLIMYRKIPSEILLETCYEGIRAMAIRETDHYTGIKRKELHLLLKDDEVIRLHAKDSVALQQVLENMITRKELILEDNLDFPDKHELLGEFLQPGEEITHQEKIWYQVSVVTGGSTQQQWKSGHLYITDKRLCWWYDFEQKMVLDIPAERLVHAALQENPSDNVPVRGKSLYVLYKEGKENKLACFSNKVSSLLEWEKVIKELTIEHGVEKRTAACPRCGKKGDRESLLEKGCSRCGWISQRIK